MHIYTKYRIALKARSDRLLKFQLSFSIQLRSIKIVIVAGINVETAKQLLISVSVASGDYSLSRKAVQ